MDFVMTGQVTGALTDYGQIVGTLDFEHLVLLPLAVLPGPDAAGKLAEVDFRIKIGGKVTAMVAAVDVNDVDGVDLVEVVVGGQGGIGIDHTRVKTGPQNGGDFVVGTFLLALPFVIAVPGRVFADFGRILVDGGVDVSSAGFNTGAHDRHVEEGRAYVNNNLCVECTDKFSGGRHIKRIQLITMQFGGLLPGIFFLHTGGNGLTFGERS